MKLRLSILLLAAALAATPAAGQTIKSLGFNTTNGQVVYSGTNPLTFTNSVGFATNARAATRTNLGATTVGNSVFTATNAAAAATAIGLGTANEVNFNRVQVGGATMSADSFSGGNFAITATHALTFESGGTPGATLTNLGLGATNAVTFGRISAGDTNALLGTLVEDGGVSVTLTRGTDPEFPLLNLGYTNDSIYLYVPVQFATNVTVNGNLSVGSLTTTTPSTWALDATQTAADTNGILALPSNANVIRLTNNNAISGVSGGVLGAFYYLVNQTTNSVTISNVGGITVQGGTSLTLGANQTATLVATGPTNASVAARGDLNDVTLGGTANTAPNQTASSGSSLMTRDLTDQRQTDRMIAGPRMVWLTTFNGWVTSTSGGSVNQNQYLGVNSGTNEWNYAVARNFGAMELFSGAGDTLNFSKAGGFGAAYFSSGANYRNGTDVIYTGARYDYVPSTGSAVSNPATKGFGWRIKDESIVATMFNTNYVEVGTNSAVLSSGANTRQNVWLYIDWNGTGGATWYVNGSSIASTTNGPTGATSQNDGWLIFGSVADIGLTQQNQNSITAFVLDREP